MTPNRPYLLRAFYEWLVDNELTPHVVVDAELPQVKVPRQYVQDGQIVLNIAPQAVGGLTMNNDAVSFSARFSGVLQQVYLPMWSISAIYARENGAGTVFQDESEYTAMLMTEQLDEPELVEASKAEEANISVDEGADEPQSRSGRPSLRVVK